MPCQVSTSIFESTYSSRHNATFKKEKLSEQQRTHRRFQIIAKHFLLHFELEKTRQNGVLFRLKFNLESEKNVMVHKEVIENGNEKS